MELWDLMNQHLISREKFKQVTEREKKKCSYIINRTQSIKYIAAAQALNVNGINTARVVDYWNSFFVLNKVTRPPDFWRTKVKITKTETKKIPKILEEKELVAKYINRNRLGTAEWEYLLDIDQDGVVEDLKKLKAYLKEMED